MKLLWWPCEIEKEGILGLKLFCKAKILQNVKSRASTDSLVLKGKQWKSGTSGSLWPVWSSAFFFNSTQHLSTSPLFLLYCLYTKLFHIRFVFSLQPPPHPLLWFHVTQLLLPCLWWMILVLSLLHLFQPQQFFASLLSEDELAIRSL